MPQRELVVLVDVPVQTQKSLVRLGFGVDFTNATGIVAVAGAQRIRNQLQVGVVDEAHHVGASFVAATWQGVRRAKEQRRAAAGDFSVHEEKQLVLDNRAAQTETGLVVVKLSQLSALPGGGVGRGAFARGVLVAAENECRAGKFIRAGTGHGVHATAAEAALPHIVRRDNHLKLLDGIERDGVGARLAARRARAPEAEQVVVGSAVNLDVVETAVAARQRVAVGLGREAGKVLKATRDSGQTLDLFALHSGGSPSAAGVHHRVAAAAHGHFG